jgi:hypothetical protein
MLGFRKESRNPLSAKLSVLRKELGRLNEKQGSVEGQAQVAQVENTRGTVDDTIANDGTLSQEVQQAIEQDEQLVRNVLAMLGLNYDTLISLEPVDGKMSPYARAVQANPAVLQQVLENERPVLAALQVAMTFEPFAEFVDKYGEDPQSIREAIRQEMKDELSATARKENAQEEKPMVSPFSQNSRRITRGTGSGRQPSLASILNK